MVAIDATNGMPYSAFNGLNGLKYLNLSGEFVRKLDQVKSGHVRFVENFRAAADALTIELRPKTISTKPIY